MADADADPAPTPSQPQTVTIALTTPIQRGESTISQISLRKPKAGELRSLKVEDLFATDVNTLFVLLPRITQPTLTQQDVAGLETEDLLEIAGAVKGFFMPPSMKEAIAKALGG
jgi:hypothetical protein